MIRELLHLSIPSRLAHLLLDKDVLGTMSIAQNVVKPER